ncbi:GL20259 [Drosophila persimilis]|nr:GL20259 [Drosophila persimilis]
MSQELITQHEAIEDLQQTEEMVVEFHRSVNATLETFLNESKTLYTQTNYVNYDQEDYCKRGELMFAQLMDIATQCRDMMAEYRIKLAKEEMLSCKYSPNSQR